MENEQIIQKSEAWVDRFVIGLQLCPFAKHPFQKGQVRFEVCIEKEMEAQLAAFWKEIELLFVTPKEKISNTILIYPNSLTDFGQYLQLYDIAERLLTDQRKQEEFQLASFHPDYQFDKTEKDDAVNFTNRSPYPFIHILRVEEVAAAISGYPDIEGVPLKNQNTMKNMGLDKIKTLCGRIAGE